MVSASSAEKGAILKNKGGKEMKGNIHKFITAISLVAMIVATCFAAIPVQAATTTMTADLIIDGGSPETATDVGEVVVDYNNETGVVNVTYAITDTSWTLSETHVYVGTEEPTKSAPGQFPYSADLTTGVCTVQLDPETSPVYVAAHAVVTHMIELVDEEGKPIFDDEGNPIFVEESESGWAQALMISVDGIIQSQDVINEPIKPGKNWATFFNLIPQIV